jgi:hypothetical protein
VTLTGPLPPDTSFKAGDDTAFDLTRFTIDWDARHVICPQGKTRSCARLTEPCLKARSDLPSSLNCFRPAERIEFWRREGWSEWLGAGPEQTMLGTPRLARLLGGCADDSELIAALLAELGAFTDAGWEQDDDITAATRRAVGRRGARAGRAEVIRSLGS